MNLIQVVEQLLEQYGYLVLLVGLPLDFIASPIPPGNSTLTYTGYLAYRGILQTLPSLASALTGALIGVTVTYFLGRKLGTPLIERYGRYLLLKPSVVEKTKRFYDKYGNKLLLFIFFVPGIRQFIGYFIGIIGVPFRTVIVYAYTGAGFWVLFFFGIGYIFGEQWQAAFDLIERYIKYVLLAAACTLVSWFLVKTAVRARQS
ncbi:DedA family protein [Paenibacillus sp. y28]|uniref:DedA family protein n=1 Tax=Paenibacillus sp. y28 TaxID=3129110 RepID=UPI003019F8BE